MASVWRGAATNRTYLIEYSLNNAFFFDGATRDLNGGWEIYAGPVYRRRWPWPAQYIGPNHPSLDLGDGIGGSLRRREVIVQDDLRMLDDQASLALIDQPGEFFVDGWPDIENAWVYARFWDDVDPNSHSIRSTQTQDAGFFAPYHGPPAAYTGCGTPSTSNYITVLGFAWRNSSTMAHNRHGVCATAEMAYEDGEVYNHQHLGFVARGDDDNTARGIVVRHMHIHHNGVGGLNGRAVDGALIEHNLVEYNSYRDIMVQEEQEGFASAGGGKWVHTTNSVFRRNVFQHNEGGAGLWFDHLNTDNIIDRNRFTDNYVVGVFFEVGSDHNALTNNLFVAQRRQSKTSTGWFNAGDVYTVSSANNLVAYNTIVAGEGTPVAMREDSRWTWSSRSVNNVFINNALISSPSAAAAPGPFYLFKMAFFVNPEDAATNLTGGNFLGSDLPGPHRRFHIVNAAGTIASTDDLAALTAWNGDATSYVAQSGMNYVANATDLDIGWVPAPGSGLHGRAVAIPEGYRITDADMVEDYFGNPRPAVVAYRHVGAAEAGPVAAPPTPWPLPGRIEAEAFRPGGEGVGYHDTTPGNSSGGCRSTDVDIKNVGSGNCVVGFFDLGEWLAYDVNVLVGGSYVLELRVARGAMGPSMLHVEANGADITGVVEVPPTAAWESFVTVRSPAVVLSSRPLELRIVNDGGFFDLDWLQTQLATP